MTMSLCILYLVLNTILPMTLQVRLHCLMVAPYLQLTVFSFILIVKPSCYQAEASPCLGCKVIYVALLQLCQIIIGESVMKYMEIIQIIGTMKNTIPRTLKNNKKCKCYQYLDIQILFLVHNLQSNIFNHYCTSILAITS